MSSHFPADYAGAPKIDHPRRAVFMGTPQFATPALDALAGDPNIAVVAAYTPPDRRRGRGQAMAPPPVKQRALELGIPVEQPRTLRDGDAVRQLAAYRPDVIVVAAYGRLLPKEALALPRFGCLNIHPSLLPRHRGPSPVAGAILAGDEVTGVTIMLLDEGMDTGPAIARRERRITAADNADTLTAALFRDGADLLLETLPGWVCGSIPAIPQDESLATYTAKLERSDGRADWSRPSATLWRMQRAYSPWPGLYTTWEGKEVKLLEVEPIPGGLVEPGLVVEAAEAPIAVGAGDGLLAVRRLQLEGRRPASDTEFARGYSHFIGARLG